MALVWPDQRVALVIEDDEGGEDFNEKFYPGWTVVRTTCSQVEDQEGFRDLAAQLAEALGEPQRDRCPV